MRRTSVVAMRISNGGYAPSYGDRAFEGKVGVLVDAIDRIDGVTVD